MNPGEGATDPAIGELLGYLVGCGPDCYVITKHGLVSEWAQHIRVAHWPAVERLRALGSEEGKKL